jgi:hypothetical protein
MDRWNCRPRYASWLIKVQLSKLSGWNVTIQYPIIPNPIYTITIDYTTTQHIVIWEGTWQNGTIEEANYSFTP